MKAFMLLAGSLAALLGMSASCTQTNHTEAQRTQTSPIEAMPTDSRPTEAASFLGEPLRRPELSPEKLARLTSDLNSATTNAANDPSSVEAAVWVGRRLSYLGRYREAVDWYTLAISRLGNSAYLLRHRGHRFITLRQLDRACLDLAQAQQLARSLPEHVEPDGIPSPGGPRTTLQGNIDYHLALAFFLQGECAGAKNGSLDAAAAAAAWRQTVDRANNDDSRVAAIYWLAITEFERGHAAAAMQALQRVHANMEILENRTYHQLCLAFKGDLAADSLVPKDGPLGLGVDRATLGFGLAMHARHIAMNEPLAMKRLIETSQLPEWASFGVIASEAVLKGNDGASALSTTAIKLPRLDSNQ